MATIKLKEISETNAKIQVHVNLDKRGSTGYNTEIRFSKHEGDVWTAMIAFDDMPAIERLGLYCREMSKALKGKNIKHLNIDGLFKPKHRG